MDIVKSLRNVRKTVASFSLAALVASFFAIGVAQAQTFPDVQAEDWFYAPVEDLVALGVVNGSMDAYRPGDDVNRAEMAKLVVEAFEIPLENPETATFKDVAENDWFYPYVETAAASGIVSGYMNDAGELTGYYGAGDSLTREQASKMIVLGAPLTINTNCGPSFDDVGINRWSYEFVETLYVNSVIDGYTDGSFQPGNNINRAEIAKIVSNALNPVLRPCGGFSVDTVSAIDETTIEVCYTQDYDEDSAMMVENYMVADQNGTELTVSAVEASADDMCVILTTDAQDPTKVYDITITDVMGADGSELLGTTASFDGYSVGEVGGLEVTLDGSSPEEGNIPRNGQDIVMAVFGFEAGDEEDVRIEELVLSRDGLGDPDDFENVRLYVNGIQKGSEKSVSDSTNEASFNLNSDPIEIPAGSRVLVSVRADMTGQENSENTLCLSTSDDVKAYGESTDSAVSVSGDFEICGNHQTTTSAEVGKLTYELDDFTGDINIGETNVSLSRLDLDADNKEDIKVQEITFTQEGSADSDAFANMKLFVSGSEIMDVTSQWDGDDLLVFDLSENPIDIAQGNSRVIELRGDVVGGLGDDVLFDIDEDWHILATGSGFDYEFGVNVEEVNPAPTIAQREIIGGNLAFATSGNNPTVGDVAAGAEDFVFLAFNLNTGGDGIEVDELNMTLNCGAPGVSTDIEDVKIVKLNDADELVTVSEAQDPSGACPADLAFNDNWEQEAGTLQEYFVTADVSNSAVDTATFSIEFDTATISAEYLSNGDNVNAGDISGGVLSGKTQTVDDPELNVTLASVPGDQNIVGGQNDIEVAGWNFEASSASDIKVTSVTIDCAYNDDSGDGDVCSDVFAGLDLYLKEGSTYTLLDGNEDVTGGNAVFNNVNLVIEAGQSSRVVLRADTSSAADATTTLTPESASFSIQAAGDIIAEDEEFNTLDAAQKNPAPLSFPTDSRTVTFVGSGTLTVEVAGDTPTEQAVLAGTSDLEVAKWKFTADENEDIEIQKLRITNIDFLDDTNYLGETTTVGEDCDGTPSGDVYFCDDEAVQVYLYVDGTEVGNATFVDGVAEFTGLNIDVPADSSVFLEARVDTSDISSSLAESNHQFTLAIVDLFAGATPDFDTNIDIKAVGANSGELLTDAEIIAASTVGYTAGEQYDTTADLIGHNILYETLPTLTRTNDSPEGNGSGSPADTLLEFEYGVVGDGGKSGALTQLGYTLNGSCAGSVAGTTVSLRLDGQPVIVDDNDNGILGDVATEFKIGSEVSVQGGTSETYTLSADSSVCTVDQKLGITISSFTYDDDSGVAGDAPYAATTADSYRKFTVNPIPLSGATLNY
ncbi:hypothetical protein GF340_03495 [Candidatus Peregrinibacteria bacterium]|nr:hypothetical protein [Candidatus Peregrinibacteria bacterium]